MSDSPRNRLLYAGAAATGLAFVAFVTSSRRSLVYSGSQAALAPIYCLVVLPCLIPIQLPTTKDATIDAP